MEVVLAERERMGAKVGRDRSWTQPRTIERMREDGGEAKKHNSSAGGACKPQKSNRRLTNEC